MSARTVIPQADCPEKRVESGPLKFGDDWTGTFLRGDRSMLWSFVVEEAVEAISPKRGFLRDQLRGLVSELRACDERNETPPAAGRT